MSTCNETLKAQGKAYPRTCQKCGLGPCIGALVQPKSTACPECKTTGFHKMSCVTGGKNGLRFSAAGESLPLAATQAPAPAPDKGADGCRPTFKPGSWADIQTVDDLEQFYLSRLPAIRRTAEALGYAVGLHGSCRRDLDLIAAPWREGAVDADTLAHAVAQAACGIDRAGAYDWEQKPAGRVATSIPICWPAWHGQPGAGHIDLSVMPAAVQSPAVVAQKRCPKMQQEDYNDMMRLPGEVVRKPSQCLPECPACGHRYCGDGAQLCVDCASQVLAPACTPKPPVQGSEQ